MHNRTFIGLAFLIVALLVAATPQLLTPTAAAVERAGIAVGLFDKPEKDYEREKGDGKGVPADNRLELRGYVVEEDGDLVDVSRPGTRAVGTRRLSDGQLRTALPGAPANADPLNPPTQGDGVLLDATNCPIFPANADIAAILADPKERTRYTAKAQSSDDPRTCLAGLNRKIKQVTSPTGFPLPGDARRAASSVRGDSERLMFDLWSNGMYEELFEGWVDAPKEAVRIREDLAGTE